MSTGAELQRFNGWDAFIKSVFLDDFFLKLGWPYIDFKSYSEFYSTRFSVLKVHKSLMLSFTRFGGTPKTRIFKTC